MYFTPESKQILLTSELLDVVYLIRIESAFVIIKFLDF